MAGKRNRKRSEKKTGIFYDYSMLFLVIFLIFFGLIMLYSTSYYSASIHQNDGMYYLKRQGSFAILGIAVMLLVSKIDTKDKSILAGYAPVRFNFITNIRFNSR